MIGIIIMLIIGIILSWDHVKKEVSDSVKGVFSTEQPSVPE